MLVAAVTNTVITGLTSGNLGLALRAGFISAMTVALTFGVGEITGHQSAFASSNHIANIAGHAAVGCVSAAAAGGSCNSSEIRRGRFVRRAADWWCGPRHGRRHGRVSRHGRLGQRRRRW
jgi:hypothetical protein